jgi:ADP-ribose pyrophosphatase YjhB (NUDIX family)
MQLFVGAKGLVHHNGKVLLLRESSKYLDGAELGKWDVPGGRINSEETLREGLVREVKEESGLDVEPGEILGAFDGFPMIRGEKCHVARIYFACEAKNTDPKDVEGKELVNDIAEILEIFRKKP